MEVASSPSLLHLFRFTCFWGYEKNSQDADWRHIKPLIHTYCKSMLSFPRYLDNVPDLRPFRSIVSLCRFYGKNAIPWEPFTSHRIFNSSIQRHQPSFVLNPHHPRHVIVSSRWQICMSHDSASLWWKFNQLSYYTTSDLQICVVYERESPGTALNLSSIHHGIIDDYYLG